MQAGTLAAIAVVKLMSGQPTAAGRNGSAEFNARAYELNEIGAHYFTGWLISAGFQKPDVMEQIENVLLDMETDPALRHCWEQETPAALPTAEAAEILASAESQAPLASIADAPPISVMPAPATPACDAAAAARRPRILARLFGSLFPKPRIAA